MTEKFRDDNTEGYTPVDLAALNQAIGYVVEANMLAGKSEIDHAMAEILAAWDRGLRDWALIEAYDNRNPWPYPPSYYTPGGPVR